MQTIESYSVTIEPCSQIEKSFMEVMQVKEFFQHYVQVCPKYMLFLYIKEQRQALRPKIH